MLFCGFAEVFEEAVDMAVASGRIGLRSLGEESTERFGADLVGCLREGFTKVGIPRSEFCCESHGSGVGEVWRWVNGNLTLGMEIERVHLSASYAFLYVSSTVDSQTTSIMPVTLYQKLQCSTTMAISRHLLLSLLMPRVDELARGRNQTAVSKY